MNFAIRQFLIVILLLFVTAHAHAQSRYDDSTLNTMNDSARVDFINKNFYTIYSADFEKAIQLTARAIDLSRRHKWKDREAYSLMYNSVIRGLHGDFAQALPGFLSARKIFDSLQHHDGLARLCNEMAVFYNRQFDRKTCDSLLLEAVRFAILGKNDEELGTSYGHQATLLERDGDIVKAEELYRKVYDIRSRQQDSVGLGYVLIDLSNMAMRRKQIKESLQYLDESTQIRIRINDQQGVASNKITRGELLTSLRRYDEAFQHFRAGIDHALSLHYIDLARYGYEQLSKSYAQAGNYKSAFESSQLSKQLNDSLYSMEKAKLIADAQTRYETEKKEKEISLQRAELARKDTALQLTYTIAAALAVLTSLAFIILILLRQRHKRERELAAREREVLIRDALITASVASQESERKRFARDIHDGMGQLISALRLIVKPLQTTESLPEKHRIVAQAEEVLNDMHREIRSIAFNLMPQTLIQYGIVPALQEMASRIHDTGKLLVKIHHFNVDHRHPEVIEISIYRIAQEWLNNIVKYAHASAVEIQLVAAADELTLTIEDDGEGFDPDMLAQSSGHGWKNLQTRVSLMKASCDLDTKAGRRGNTLTINIPLSVENITVPSV